jgi:ketosteroid isomerase-like protein
MNRKMKNLFFFFIAVLGFYACSETKQSNSTATQNEKIVRQLYDHFNRHEWSKMANLYAESADFQDPSLGIDVVKQTRAQTIQKYTTLNETFKDIRDDITHIYVSGEKNVIVEFVSSGTAPDGSAFKLPICTIFTIENGVITQDFTYYDNSNG